MNLEILISTMHQTDYSLLDKIGIRSDAVVVNQCKTNEIHQFSYAGNRVVWINTTERGLSKSRNMAISHASADVCLLVDEDEVLCPNYRTTILAGFEKYPEATLIGFQVEGIEGKFKDYSGEEGRVSFLRSMKMASVELAFRRASVIDAQLHFNEDIGAGTKYLMGEENTFIFQCLSHKLKAFYIPAQIARLHIGESTWFKGYNREYMVARGAVFTAMSNRFSRILILQFAFRHRKLYLHEMSMWDALKYMMTGRKEYLLM